MQRIIHEKRKRMLEGEITNFKFDDTMIRELGDLKKVKSGVVPIPKSLKKAAPNDYVKFSWNIFFNLVEFLKKQLREKVEKRKLPKDIFNNGIIFSLERKDGKFKFQIHSEWVAEQLNMSLVQESSNPCPLGLYLDIVYPKLPK